MEHGTEVHGDSSHEKRTNALKRFVRYILKKLMPPAPYNPAKYVHELTSNIAVNEEAEQQLTVTRAENGTFSVRSDDLQPLGPFTTHYDSLKIFRELAAIYLPFGSGKYSFDNIAVRVRFKSSTVSHIAKRLTGIFPDEVIAINEKDKEIAFGNLVLVSLLEGLPEQYEAEEDIHKQTPEQINDGKLELTLQAHAIVEVSSFSKERFYLPLHSPAGILAARVIEAIEHLRMTGASKGVRSSEIAEHVWQSMTLTERQLFVDEESALLLYASDEIEIPVIRVLRRLTNKLMLTHEPRNDRFTLLSAELSIQYNDLPLSEGQTVKLEGLRPIIQPEQIEDEPSKEQQSEYINLARVYMRQAKNRSAIADQDALEMLDFLMSPFGHWAVRVVAGEKGMFKTYDGAMYAMHTYLRVHFHGYAPAYRSRLISGNRCVRRSRRAGGIRQVGGALPKESNWVLGQGMQEFFGETTINPDSKH